MTALELSDEQAVALVRLLHEAINGDRYPLSPRPDTEGDPREAATRAGPTGSFAGAEGVCAANEGAI